MANKQPKKFLIPHVILRHRERATKFLIMIAFPVVGCVLLFLAPYVADLAPFLIGITMTVTGLVMFIHALVRHEFKQRDTYNAAVSIVLLLCGAVILIRRQNCMDLLCITWGLYGIFFSVDDLNELLYRIAHRKKCLTLLIETLFTLTLSAMLLLDPGESHFVLHVRLLGAEMILFSIQPEHFYTATHSED